MYYSILPIASTEKDWWIGATDAALEGAWYWDGTGQSLTYTNWGQNQPDNNSDMEHCALLSYKNTLMWYDYDCSKKQMDGDIFGICEAPST